MKKTLLAFTAFSFVAMGTAKAQLFLSQNFNATAAPALPTNWATTPAGWQTGAPATVAPDLATEFGDFAVPEHSAIVGIDGSIATNNNVILSTPAFTPAAGAKLMYDVSYFKYRLSADQTKIESLSYAFSTDGGMTWSADNAIAANIVNNATVTWLTNSIDIPAMYAGQSIKIGFKYGNSGVALVGAALDNVKVILGTDIQMMKLTANNVSLGSTPNTVYAVTGSSITFAGVAKNAGTTSITTATTAYGPTASAGTATGLPAASGASVNTSYTATPFVVPAGSTTVKAWVKTTGDLDVSNDTATITVIGVASLPAKKILFEEATGTWCGWCPRGAVGMDDFSTAHPGVASQVAVHNSTSDPMTLSAYDSYMTGNFVSGFPSMVMDRKVVTDPSDISNYYAAHSNDFGYADVTMSAPTVTGTNVSVTVTVKPTVDIANSKVALVITESNVEAPAGNTSNSWKQHNYYTGNAQGVMGGFESKPEYAVMRYHFVGRSITDPTGTTSAAGGTPAGWPATLVAGQTYTATMTATLNSAWKPANLQYVVLLNDGTSKATLNTAFSATPALLPIFPTVAIENVEAGISNAFIYPNPTTESAFLQVNLKDATTGSIVITDATGRVVSTKDAVNFNNGKNVIEIPSSNLSSGLYFVNLITAKGNISMKFQVAK